MARRKGNVKKRRTRKRKEAVGVSDEFLASLGIKRKLRKEPKIIKSELPKPKWEEDMEKEQVIEDIFDGKLELFLKRYYRMNRISTIHSKLIPKWKEERKSRRAIRWLDKKLEWPLHKRQVINLLRTLEKYYEADISRQNMELAWELWELFHEEISKHFSDSWMKTVDRRKWDKVKKLNKKQAWAEQKAIGYIHVNDFEDYDKEAAHVFSNVKRDYLYPMNFYHGGCMKYADSTHIYIGLPLVGIEGHSRSVIPT